MISEIKLISRLLRGIIDRSLLTTSFHANEVAYYAGVIAEAMRIKDRELLIYASYMHDIGKLFDVEFYRKNATVILKDEDWARIRRHPIVGYELIKGLADTFEGSKKREIEKLAVIVLQHHERLDGKGYPHGIQGSELLLESKILSVCDAFNAMRTRKYREPISEESALSELYIGRGKQFDSDVVECFYSLLKNDCL